MLKGMAIRLVAALALLTPVVILAGAAIAPTGISWA
jgi:hypothetical protein